MPTTSQPLQNQVNINGSQGERHTRRNEYDRGRVPCLHTANLTGSGRFGAEHCSSYNSSHHQSFLFCQYCINSILAPYGNATSTQIAQTRYPPHPTRPVTQKAVLASTADLLLYFTVVFAVSVVVHYFYLPVFFVLHDQSRPSWSAIITKYQVGAFFTTSGKPRCCSCMMKSAVTGQAPVTAVSYHGVRYRNIRRLYSTYVERNKMLFFFFFKHWFTQVA